MERTNPKFMASLRSQTYVKYTKFVQKLLQSPSKEIRFLSKILINDPRSTIGKNVWFLDNLTNESIVVTSNSKVKQLIPINPIPANDQEAATSSFRCKKRKD